VTAAGRQLIVAQNRDNLIGLAVVVGVAPTMNGSALREPSQPL
jgi:hypothetical protein